MNSSQRPEIKVPKVSDFEDHCWRSLVPEDVLHVYSHYARQTTVGDASALIAIDLYELAYQGGPRPIGEIVDAYPSSCGESAWNAIPATLRLFDAARDAGLPVLYSTTETCADSRLAQINATRRRSVETDPSLYEIRAEFAPRPGDVVVRKQRASAFFGTPLVAHLTQSGIRTVVLCGQTTSGCLRATAVDAYSYGFHVVVVEECCFDRSLLSHQINLFDLHHKYADVMHVDEVVSAFVRMGPRENRRPRPIRA